MGGDLRSFEGDISVKGGNDVLLGGPGDDGITGDHRALGGAVSGKGGNDAIDGGQGATASSEITWPTARSAATGA